MATSLYLVVVYQFNKYQEEKIIMTKTGDILFNETSIHSPINLGFNEDRIYFTSTGDFYYMNYEEKYETGEPIETPELEITQISYHTFKATLTINSSIISILSFLIIFTLIFKKKKRKKL